LLLNSQSVYYIGQCEYKKAEITLQDVLGKDSNDIDSLVKSSFISIHTKISADVNYCCELTFITNVLRIIVFSIFSLVIDILSIKISQ